MKSPKCLIKISIFFVLLDLIFSRSSYAYLDLGTGSFVLQVVLAGFIGYAFTVKSFWKKVKIFFHSLQGKKNTGRYED